MVPIPYTPKGTPVVETVAYDGIDFKTVTWKVPENVTCKGKIVYVHGFCEESTIYTEFFDRLSQEGYEIFFFDQRGAGKTSPGAAFGITDEFHTFDDLDFMIKRILDAGNDSEKIFLGGHSMGGGIALNYAIYGKHRDHIRGIFVSGPLVTLHPKTQPNIVLRKLQPVINKLMPTFRIDSKLVYDYITSHEAWKKYIMSNEGKLLGSVRQFNDMFARGEKLTKKEHVSQFSTSIPLLVLHGESDYINDIEGTKKFISHLPSSVEKKFVPVAESRHSIFIEREGIMAPVLAEVVDFLNAH